MKSQSLKHLRSSKDGIVCGCGKFIARLIPEGVEIKCRRCRNLIIIPLSNVQGNNGCP